MNRCIDLLAKINATGSAETRAMALEIGYILKQELDVVVSLEQATAGGRNPLVNNVSPDNLLKDNIQLFNENQKLIKENMSLKEMLESRVVSLASKMESVKDGIHAINATIRGLV